MMRNEEDTSDAIIGRVLVVLVGAMLRAVRLWERYYCDDLKDKTTRRLRLNKRSEDIY